ncbi:MAG: hypothetical protein ABSB97_08340 [Thermoplasmata archaeon]|jgi:hypothetical protein
MSRRVDLLIDPLRGDRVPIELPLEYRVPVEKAREEVGFSPWVDLSDPIVAKAVALIGAARRSDPPVRLAFFGGTAHRLTCPASNLADSGLRHDLHDLDVAVLLKDGRSFQQFLESVGKREGSGLTFFETPGDRVFNSMTDGHRLRWHTVVTQQGSEVSLGTLDIIADEFRFCHRFDVREDVKRAPTLGWTLSPAHLLLTKGQFILRVPQADAATVRERVLEPFGKRDVVIGPEPKDVRDMLALLHDHPIDDGPGGISPSETVQILGSDWGLWKTFSLNLGMVSNSAILADLRPEARTLISERLTKLRSLVASLTPKRRFGFLGGEWWQEVDSTAFTDATVPTSGPT